MIFPWPKHELTLHSDASLSIGPDYVKEKKHQAVDISARRFARHDDHAIRGDGKEDLRRSKHKL